MKKRIEEKEILEKQIQGLSEKIDKLITTKEETEQEIQGLRNIQETMTKNYNTFIITKYRLKR